MREILFRGKRVDNGEWVEGYYVNSIGPDCEPNETRHYIVTYPGDWHEVYTSTVGQYTGITDRKGNRIFEGDHVKVYYRNDNNEFEPVSAGIMLFFSGSFRLKTMSFLETFPTTQYTQYEVVGNVADNGEYPL